MSDRRSNRLRILEQLVIDCSRFDFSEQESLHYICARTGGKGIERSQYYAIKKRIKKNELNACEIRLAYHTKSGFLANHFKRMDEGEFLQSLLFRTLHNEISKPVAKQSPFAISKIASIIMTNSQYLHTLNITSPIIDKMKEYIHTTISAKEIKENVKVPEGLNALDDSNWMGTPKQLECIFKKVKSTEQDEPADRVF